MRSWRRRRARAVYVNCLRYGRGAAADGPRGRGAAAGAARRVRGVALRVSPGSSAGRGRERPVDVRDRRNIHPAAPPRPAQNDGRRDPFPAQATPRLARATHAHEGDLTHVSKARNSQQATVRPAGGARNTRDLSDPIARLKARRRVDLVFATYFKRTAPAFQICRNGARTAEIRSRFLGAVRGLRELVLQLLSRRGGPGRHHGRAVQPGPGVHAALRRLVRRHAVRPRAGRYPNRTGAFKVLCAQRVFLNISATFWRGYPDRWSVAAQVAGGRLATVLMYCEAADGGGTSFPNANVHVVPHRGQAVYFHFRAPEADSVMEDWHTEHSGCPVREGSKWVITQWLRDGVSKENPHTRFDPSGGPVGRA